MDSQCSLTQSSIIDVDKNLKKTTAELVNHTRDVFKSRKTIPIAFRKKQLRNFLEFFDKELDSICEAVEQDLKKPRLETITGEIELVKREINTTLKNIDSWAKPERVTKSVVNVFDELLITSDPYGVVLVMGAWNYPILVLLIPVAGAIAAGNCVIIKPSELAQATANVIANRLPKYLDNECYPIFLGGPEETGELLQQKFDYIAFTGSPQVGKIIYQAASKHLTPVTLELGGKSPVYIDDTVNLRVAAKRIVWGKFQNCGQICIAPDYILCSKDVQAKLIGHIEEALKQFYKDSEKTSKDYGRIINQRHFERLIGLLKNQIIAIGGHMDATDRYISPTVLIDVNPEDSIMQEEIFGPLLPILNVKNSEEAIDFINSRQKPLALYVFTNKSKVKKDFMERTSSGAMVINDTVMHVVTEGLPFGGVGESGMGAYKGKLTFDTFVHRKSVLSRQFNIIGEKLESTKYPPYTDFSLKFIRSVIRYNITIRATYLPHLLMFGLGVAATISCYYINKYFQKE